MRTSQRIRQFSQSRADRRYTSMGRGRVRVTTIAASLALALGGTAALGAPQGGVVQAGAAQIVHTNPTRLDIVQSTNRAVINWQSFSIGAKELVNFQQPSRQAATLNRVIGVDPSVILGRLTANGVVFLVNANGVLFGPGSKIDVGSLIATTAGISNENFMAGRYRFDQVTNRFATVVNRGEITAAEGGLVALVAPGVENTGIIRANLGKVALASGNAFTLDLFGDKLIALAIDDKVAAKLTDPEGRPLAAYVNQAGTIEADGGTVLLTANAAKTVLDNVINLSGTIQARSFAQLGGEIVLYGGDEGTVRVSGVLDASGKRAGETGGNIQVLGENVQLASVARINVSGDAGGGSALVGGDWQGSGTMPRATNATVEAGAKVSADALTNGNGGKVVVWAQGETRFEGAISARGGASAGDGGQVEVSGKGTLSYTGLVDAAAPNGKAGTLLLDPFDWTVNARLAFLISNQLAAGTNVALQTDRDIAVNESIDGRGGIAGASLVLSAGDQIRLNNDLNTNNGAIALTAGPGGVQMGPGSQATGNQGALVFAGTQPITIAASGTISAQHLITSGAVRLESTTGTVQLNQPLLGAKDSNGVGPVTIRSAGDFTLTQPIKSSGGIDIQAGGADAASARALVLAVGTTNRVEANAGGSANPQPITLGGKSVAITSGEVHSNGGNIDINARNGGVLVGAGIRQVEDDVLDDPATGTTKKMDVGRFAIDPTSGLFANGGDITINATDRVDLTRLSLTGNLKVYSTRGSIFIDSDLGGDLVDVNANTHTPQPLTSVTLAAGGTYEQERFYYGGPFDPVTGVVTNPDVVRTSSVAVRVRGLKSNGPVMIDGQSTTGEILLDGIIEAKGDVTLNAPTIRARHSVFADGGNITVGGRLIVEPWGDEIGFQPGPKPPSGGLFEKPAFTIIVDPSSFPSEYTDSAGPKSAPGSDRNEPPSAETTVTGNEGSPVSCGGACGDDLASSQVTLRATRPGARGGEITLTNGTGTETFVGEGSAAMRRDQQHVRLDRGARPIFETDSKGKLTLKTDSEGNPLTDSNGLQIVVVKEQRGLPSDCVRCDRTKLTLVPLNDVRLNLQADTRVAFRADRAEGSFLFFGPTRDKPGGFSGPVFRLAILDSLGRPVPGLGQDEKGQPLPASSVTLTVVGAADPENFFSGFLQSYNANKPATDPSAENPVPVVGLPGALHASEGIEITGQPPPPGPTPGGPPSGFPEIFVGTNSGIGSAGLLGGASATDPSVAAQSQSASLTERFEREEDVPVDLGVARYADLGRLQPAAGAAPEVFEQSSGLIANRGELPTTADRDYFGRGVFEYLDSNSRRKRQPMP